jgi:predicted nucleic-acid-binding Zn-ribbon protein
LKEVQNCPKCQSDKVIPDVQIIDRAGHVIRLGVKVFEHPEALVFKGAHAADLRSRVCGECGYVESYVENPQELYSAYQASKHEPRG